MFIILFILFSQVICLNIGDIKTPKFDLSNIIQTYITNIGNPNLKYVKSCDMSTSNTEEKLDECLNDFYNNEDTKIAIAYCDENMYNFNFTNYLSMSIWCINALPPRICVPNIISGLLTNYIMENSIFYLLFIVIFLLSNIYSSNFVYIGGSDDISNEVVVNDILSFKEFVGINFLGYTNENTTMEDLVKICEDHANNDGCVILCGLDDATTIENFLTEIKVNNILPAAKAVHITFIYDTLTEEVISGITSKSSLVGMTSVKTYSTQISGSDPIELTSSTRKVFDARVIGILNLLNEAYTILPTEEIEVLLTAIYDKEVDYPGGKIMLRSNNYLTTQTYVYVLDTSGNDMRNIFILRLNEIYDPLSYFNEVNYEKCDFVTNYLDGIVERDLLIILYINAMSEDSYYSDRIINEFILTKIRNINKQGGVLDKEIIPLYVSIKDFDSEDKFVNKV